MLQEVCESTSCLVTTFFAHLFLGLLFFGVDQGDVLKDVRIAVRAVKALFAP